MTITAFEVVTILSDLAQQAQSTGLVPAGMPVLVLSGLSLALKGALASGVLTSETPIEMDDIGQEFTAAVQRMRDALSA
jgi:hypothetical protein